jgi:hypothetical protein
MAITDDEMRRLADVMWARMSDGDAAQIARAVWTLQINHPYTDGKISPAALLRGSHIKVARSEGKIDTLIAQGGARDAVLAQLAGDGGLTMAEIQAAAEAGALAALAKLGERLTDTGSDI